MALWRRSLDSLLPEHDIGIHCIEARTTWSASGISRANAHYLWGRHGYILVVYDKTEVCSFELALGGVAQIRYVRFYLWSWCRDPNVTKNIRQGGPERGGFDGLEAEASYDRIVYN
ncbi:hypothetical protein BC938DRAFT_472266 [Jimgerdemannia flammicorona]|uniref:Uncharacterized protein n=1 Tax=Jimgerdemannia flammicorona TaxID=994334 RepID=A0A433Q6H8_9FUNG|nr:hypothetical protein BC938DRAFT_472266 [Jimgerdemannia flammicorona]